MEEEWKKKKLCAKELAQRPSTVATFSLVATTEAWTPRLLQQRLACP